nr:HAMP domain-containing sensor histidine kinase [Schlegelella koreensis]
MALDDAKGIRIGSSESFDRRMAEGLGRPYALHLDDGRTLWLIRGGWRQANREARERGGERSRGDAERPGRASAAASPRADGRSLAERSPDVAGSGVTVEATAERGDDAWRGRSGAERRRLPPPLLPFVPAEWQRSAGLLVLLIVLFAAVSAAAYPVVRRLTRRLETLKRGVEQFGEGALDHRVDASGSDEVAAVAASFNVAAERVQALVQAHRSLLANASHELRSPLARMKMAVSMLDDASPAQRESLKREIDHNVAELDALVEEVLLASRLDARHDMLQHERIDLLGLAAEEAARIDAAVEGPAVFVNGDERLLRRALRNLLENARRYGGGDIGVATARLADAAGAPARVQVAVSDRGPGVPEGMRERIFEPFFRLPGHAEQAGGVGLGLSLVKQIVERHGGSVRCEARDGGGSRFVIELPGDAGG